MYQLTFDKDTDPPPPKKRSTKQLFTDQTLLLAANHLAGITTGRELAVALFEVPGHCLAVLLCTVSGEAAHCSGPQLSWEGCSSDQMPMYCSS